MDNAQVETPLKIYERFSLVDCVTAELAKAGADPLSLGKYIDMVFIAATEPWDPAEILKEVAAWIKRDLENTSGARKNLQERDGRQEGSQASARQT